MNSNRIANNLVTFNRDIRSIESGTEQLRGTTQKLFSTLDALNSSWVGSAHEVYVQNVQDDRELMNNVLSTLTKFLQDMQDADRTYKTCESQVESTIASIVV